MPSVAITCPPATFLTGSAGTANTGTIDRAARRGHLQGTLDGSYIVLVRTGSYVWFATTSSLGISGVDPATHTSNLGTGYRILLSGTRTEVEVAEQLRYGASLIPGFTASRIGSTTTISGSSINSSLCHAGTTWANRGFGDIRGAREPFLGSSGPVNNMNAQALPWSGSNARLKFMRVGRITTAGTYRLAVYFSPTGTSTTDPNGATLLYDFGLTPGNITTGYEYVYCSGTYPTIPSTGTLWLTVKDNNTHGDIRVKFGGSEIFDFFNQNFFQSTATGFDPTVAYPATWSEAGASPIAVQLDMAIGFDFPPFAGAGDLEFRYGTHLSATEMPSPSNAAITGTLMMRNTAPEINGLRIISSTIGIGTTHAEQYRGGIYIGGTMTNPSGAIGYDIGQTAGSTTNAYHSVAPTGSIPIPSGSMFGAIWKQNGGGSTVLFNFGVDVDPLSNPSDWVTGSEYETFETGQMNRDETTAYESSFITASTDIRPGNFPRFHVLFRVDGFQLIEGGADPSGDQVLSASILSATFQIGTNLLASSLTQITTEENAQFSLGTTEISIGGTTFSSSILSHQFLLGTSSFNAENTLSSNISTGQFGVLTSSISTDLSIASTIVQGTFSLGSSVMINSGEPDVETLIPRVRWHRGGSGGAAASTNQSSFVIESYFINNDLMLEQSEIKNIKTHTISKSKIYFKINEMKLFSDKNNDIKIEVFDPKIKTELKLILVEAKIKSK